MKRMPFRCIHAISYASVLLFQAETHAQSLDAQSTQENISVLRQEVDHHLQELNALKRKLADEEANLSRLSRALDNRELAARRGAGPGDAGGPGDAAPQADTGAP
ncbi:acetate kinase, partial [Burkholderia pyrrocinia]|nr:acetate kinase [Burkholderia pyrrocinia]